MMMKSDIPSCSLDRSYTTSLKGVAILLILIHHIGGEFCQSRFFTPLGGIGVAIFLILSGYGLNESYKSKGLENFWTKKIVRVWFPYFLLETIFLIFIPLNGGWGEFFRDILCINSYCWFVSCIVKYYICFYIATRFFPKYRLGIFLIFSIVTLLVSPQIEAEQAFSFLFGVCLSEKKNGVFNIGNSPVCLLGLLLIGCAFLVIKQIPFVRSLANYPFYNLILLLNKLPIGIFVIFFLRKKFFKIENVLFITLGMMSYELYLVHFRLIPFFGRGPLDIVLFVLISCVIAYIYSKINQRILSFSSHIKFSSSAKK